MSSPAADAGGPVDVRFGPTRQLQPDLIVLPDQHRGGAALRPLPLLAVEVLSPSTRALDLTLKRHVFEQGGIASYWLLDPLAPSLAVLELVDGAYVETAVVMGERGYDAVRPFPVRVVPADLVR